MKNLFFILHRSSLNYSPSTVLHYRDVMQLRLPFLVLSAELHSQKENPQKIVPWSWEGTPTFFRFAEGCSDPAYPSKGMRNIAQDNPDLSPFIKSDGDWEALQAFFDAFEGAASSESVSEMYSVSLTTKNNRFGAGAKIFSSYFANLMTRSKRNREIDVLLRELGIAPYQVYKELGHPWPKMSSVSA